MEIILVLLIVAVLNGAVAYIDEMLQELVPMTLYADRYMLAANGGSMVDVLFDILLGFGVSLIILKFLKKGLNVMSCGRTGIRTQSQPVLSSGLCRRWLWRSAFPSSTDGWQKSHRD